MSAYHLSLHAISIFDAQVLPKLQKPSDGVVQIAACKQLNLLDRSRDGRARQIFDSSQKDCRSNDPEDAL